MRITALPTLLLVGLSAVTAQSTLVVPSAFASIQAAIVAATAGDTVLVLPGAYVERLDFLGKAISVRSSAGAAVTTIDGNQLGTVVTFASNETAASVLDGFTITGGLGAPSTVGVPPRSGPGGVLCRGASPTIRRCVITGNQGGPGAPSGAGTLAGNGGPGGILAQSSALRLIDCDVAANTGGIGGTGNPGGPLGSNGAGGRGGAGAAWLEFGAAGSGGEVRRCRFTGNQGGAGGTTSGSGITFGGRGGDGGVELFATVPARLAECVIAANRGGDGGLGPGAGAIPGNGGNGGFDVGVPGLQQVLVDLASCACVGNLGGNAGGPSVGAQGGSGAGATGGSLFAAIGCTFAGNATGNPASPNTSGGVTLGGSMTSTMLLVNCIAWGNTRAGVPADVHVIGTFAGANSCDIGVSTGTVLATNGISIDPLFANLAAGDVHLTAASPCRHAGQLAGGQSAFDLDGDPRVVGPAVDMGADEFDGLVGTREDFALELLVNGVAAAAVVTSTAAPGDVVALRLWSPAGTLAAAPGILGIEPWLPPSAPLPPLALPGLQLSASAFVALGFGGGVGGAGTALTTTIPGGLSGLALRLQAFAFPAAPTNGVFVATAARDLLL